MTTTHKSSTILTEPAQTMNKVNWKVKTFNELSVNELYDILKLRVDVFVVEQACYYPELDNKDRDAKTLHLFAYDQDTNTLGAYSRILAPNVSYADHVSIGRVVVSSEKRSSDWGNQLMLKTLATIAVHFPNFPIKISAQYLIISFYENFGFKITSDIYLEDNIEHINMVKHP